MKAVFTPSMLTSDVHTSTGTPQEGLTVPESARNISSLISTPRLAMWARNRLERDCKISIREKERDCFKRCLLFCVRSRYLHTEQSKKKVDKLGNLTAVIHSRTYSKSFCFCLLLSEISSFTVLC